MCLKCLSVALVVGDELWWAILRRAAGGTATQSSRVSATTNARGWCRLITTQSRPSHYYFGLSLVSNVALRIVCCNQAQYAHLPSFQTNLTQCNFVTAKTGAIFEQAFMLSPTVNASSMHAFNSAIQHSLDVIKQLLANQEERSLNDYTSCRMEMFQRQAQTHGDPLLLSRVGATFVIWAIGILIAMLVWGVEMIYKHCYRKRTVTYAPADLVLSYWHNMANLFCLECWSNPQSCSVGSGSFVLVNCCYFFFFITSTEYLNMKLKCMSCLLLVWLSFLSNMPFILSHL